MLNVDEAAACNLSSDKADKARHVQQTDPLIPMTVFWCVLIRGCALNLHDDLARPYCMLHGNDLSYKSCSPGL